VFVKNIRASSRGILYGHITGPRFPYNKAIEFRSAPPPPPIPTASLAWYLPTWYCNTILQPDTQLYNGKNISSTFATFAWSPSRRKKFYIAAEDCCFFPGSQYEDPARLAILGKNNMYMLPLLFRSCYTTWNPQRLEAPGHKVIVLLLLKYGRPTRHTHTDIISKQRTAYYTSDLKFSSSLPQDVFTKFLDNVIKTPSEFPPYVGSWQGMHLWNETFSPPLISHVFKCLAIIRTVFYILIPAGALDIQTRHPQDISNG